MTVIVVVIAGILLLVKSLLPSAETDTTVQSAETNESSVSQSTNMALELPVMQEKRAEQVIEHIGYTVSYNPKWNIPNWVAYSLTADETSGDEERDNHFNPDPLVKGDPVVTRDYSNSGYDRGHMAPAGDFKWSEQAMQESFYMTNMCPQNHNLNTGDWNDLECRVRYLARKYGEVFICCGPIVQDGYETIGNYHTIAVPQAFFKTILIQKKGQWMGAAYVFDNKPKSGQYDLDHYQVTIDQLEELTNMDFFSMLPDDVEELVEKRISHL